MKHAATLLTFFIVTNCFAQNSWTKTYQDSAFIFSLFQYHESYVGFGYIGSSMYYLRTDKAGDTLVWKSITDSTFTGTLLGFSGAVTLDDQLIILGYSNINSSNEYLRLYKLDTLGNIIWRKYYPNTSPNGPVCKLVVAPDSGFALFGTNSLQGYFIKVDKSGNQVFRRDYGYNYMYPRDAVVEADGSYTVCGFFEMLNQFNNFLLHLDSLGNIIWTKALNVAYQPLFNAMTLDNSNYYVVGSRQGLPVTLYKYDLSGNLLSQPSTGVMGEVYSIKRNYDNTLICSGVITTSDTVGLIKLDTLGNVMFMSTIVALNSAETYSCFVDNDSNYVYGGRLDYKSFIAKINHSGSINISEPGEEHAIVIFPNPSAGAFHIHTSSYATQEKDIFIYDVMGKEIFSWLHTIATDFDFSPGREGIYLVKVVSDGRTVVKVLSSNKY